MQRAVIISCFVFLLLFTSYGVASSTLVQTTINVHISPDDLVASYSGTDYSFLFDKDYSFTFRYEEKGDFWTGKAAINLNTIPASSPDGTVMKESKFEWSTNFQLPYSPGGYLSPDQSTTTTRYTRTSREGGYWYCWEFSELSIGSIVFQTDEIGTMGHWSGQVNNADDVDIISFYSSPPTISTRCIEPVPEPSTLILFILGTIFFAVIRFKVNTNSLLGLFG